MNQGKLLLTTPRFRVEMAAHTKADGSRHERAVIRHPGAVTILPMVDEQHVCLIRNYRVAVGETLVELPAGTLEPPEAPVVTARRELIEETGYRAGKLEQLSTFYLSPGVLDECMYLFLATELTAGPAQREPNEEIENLVVSWDEAISWASDGTIHDAKTIVALLLYERCGRSLRTPQD